MARWLMGLLVLGALLLGALPARAQGEGVIEGQVIAAEGAALPEGAEAELLFLPNGQGPPVITLQALGDEGSFRFEALDPSPQHRYLVRVTVDGEETFSELLAFGPDESRLEVTLNLFGRTTDASALFLQQVNYILDVQASGWVVVALYRYQNDSAQIIENFTAPPVTIPLPDEALNVQFSEGVNFEGLVELPNGFAYTGPFAPGETPLIFSYVMPYGETLTLTPGDAARDRVRVLVPQLGQLTESEGLVSAGPQTLEEREYELFEGTFTRPDGSLTFRFTNLPPPPAPTEEEEAGTGSPAGPRILPISPLEGIPWWTPLLLVALAILSVVAYLLLRPAPSPAERRATLRERRDTLVAEIAALDIRFEAGAIGEQTHQRQRGLLKRELKEILQRLGSEGTEGIEGNRELRELPR